MAKIISLVQVKGGAGRSTVATNLAAFMSINGIATLLIDADLPQGTASSWFALRQQTKPSDKLQLAQAKDHRELVQQVEQAQDKFQCIIIDAPPRIAEITKAALILGDVSLIPIGAFVGEIWATFDLLKTIGEAREVKPDLDARVVWTRFRGYTRSAQDLSEAVHKELGLPEMNTKLSFRVAYPDAFAQGLGVAEWSDSNAKNEMHLFCGEVAKILKKK